MRAKEHAGQEQWDESVDDERQRVIVEELDAVGRAASRMSKLLMEFGDR